MLDSVPQPGAASGAGHEHLHFDPEATDRQVRMERQILAKNDHLAEHNQQWLGARRILAVNLMSSPGSGKTTLLERTLAEYRPGRAAVIEADQETLFDAERIRATGSPVVQVNTGAGCHLDAAMVGAALQRLDPSPGSTLFIENVGNLVCPALFKLGEHANVILVSVPEGTDKPMKYPQMFQVGSLVVLNKIDLLPYVDFDVERFTGYVRQLNPDAEVIQVSATRGDGLPHWYRWLERATAAVTAAGSPEAPSGVSRGS